MKLDTIQEESEILAEILNLPNQEYLKINMGLEIIKYSKG